MMTPALLPALLALVAWLWLLLAHDRFWQSGPELPPVPPPSPAPAPMPAIDIIVPARNEAETIGDALASLLAQDYPGRVRILMVDDGSSDGTGAIARRLAETAGHKTAGHETESQGRLTVLAGSPTPPGWSGKLWALSQGIEHASSELLLLTDADIVHAPGHLAAMAAKAEAERLDLVSEMVALRCESLSERALVPAFVFFFQLLYPFAAVNDPRRQVAAAAGGSILVRRDTLARAGGIAAIKGALIDDVALARKIKPRGRIWLGHSRLARSLRAYPDFGEIWRMIARTAFVQLRHSFLLLAGTVLGLGLIFLTPPAATLFAHGLARLAGFSAWVLSALLYVPTLRRFGRSLLWAPLLPPIATFYLAATIGSAVDHWRGRGVVWKGRAYRGAQS
ncbi:MAG TPA: glycosyltransferase [Acetobacteraceae bacterium]|nr:glycosyltransferase [Acetobacteraceae bacterium]